MGLIIKETRERSKKGKPLSKLKGQVFYIGDNGPFLADGRDSYGLVNAWNIKEAKRELFDGALIADPVNAVLTFEED